VKRRPSTNQTTLCQPTAEEVISLTKRVSASASWLRAQKRRFVGKVMQTV